MNRVFSRGIVLLLMLGTGFYTTRVFISPIYGFAALAGFLALLGVVSPSSSLRRKNLGYLALFAVLFAYIALSEIGNEQNSQVMFGFLLSFAVFPLALEAMANCDDAYLMKTYRWGLWIALVLFVIDAYLRFSNPNTSYFAPELNAVFYAYKFNGLMYLDSNFVGLHALVLLGSCIAVGIYSRKLLVGELILLCLALLLTLSRASILAATMLLVVALLWRSKFLRFLLPILAIAFVVVVLYFFGQDASFETKGEILNGGLAVLFQPDNAVHLAFGYGFNRTVDVIGIGSHNVLVLLLMEKGLVGLLIVVTIWLAIASDGGIYAACILLPFLINGFSLTSHSVPYLYAMLALAVELSRRARLAPGGQKTWRP